jgi:signal transduction histidine kinase
LTFSPTRDTENSALSGEENAKSGAYVIKNQSETKRIYKELASQATKEIMLLLSSVRAFEREEKIGIISLLKQASKAKGVKVRILTPTLSELSSTLLQQLKESNINIRQIKATKEEEEEEEFRATILVVDGKASLVVELRDDAKEDFTDAVGTSIYSTNRAKVQSYAMMFRSIWRETKMRERLLSRAIQLEEAGASLQQLTENLQATAKKLSISQVDLAVAGAELKSETAKRKAAELDLSKSQQTVEAGVAKLDKVERALAASEDNLATRTDELKFAEAALSESNEKLIASNKQLAAALEDLAIANATLQLNNKVQKEFINIAAHELRTPIQPILVTAELLASQFPDENDIIQVSKEELNMIIRNANRLDRLSADILSVARIESELFKLNKQRVNLKDVVAGVIEDVAKTIQGKNLKLQHKSNDVIVIADGEKIGKVLRNLLNNSIKFTDEGTISVIVKRKEGQATVAVVDTGTGIDPEIFPRLFTKFASKGGYSSDTGIGLGLYISKSIIEAHGGKIWAENNKEGKGATFTFSLPLTNNE